MESKKVLARNLRAYRKANKIAQAVFAEKAGVSVRGFGKIERCEVNASIDTLDKLAAVMGVTASELLVNEAEG